MRRPKVETRNWDVFSVTLPRVLPSSRRQLFRRESLKEIVMTTQFPSVVRRTYVRSRSRSQDKAQRGDINDGRYSRKSSNCGNKKSYMKLEEKVPKRSRKKARSNSSISIGNETFINYFFIVVFTLETKSHLSLSWPTPHYMHANANSRDLFLQSFILDWAAVCFLQWRWIRTSIYFWIIFIINSFNTMLWLINGFNYCSTLSIKLTNVSCQLCQVKNLYFSHVLVYVLCFVVNAWHFHLIH